jgi:xanthine/uracil permease
MITGSVPLVLGIGNLTYTFGGTPLPDGATEGGVVIGGIAWGSVIAIVLYHLVKGLHKLRGIEVNDNPAPDTTGASLAQMPAQAELTATPPEE